MCSEKTLYNYVDAQLFDIRNIDLPRKVKYRPRYKQPEFKVDKGCRIGRNYAAFQKFLESNPETTIDIVKISWHIYFKDITDYATSSKSS